MCSPNASLVFIRTHLSYTRRREANVPVDIFIRKRVVVTVCVTTPCVPGFRLRKLLQPAKEVLTFRVFNIQSLSLCGSVVPARCAPRHCGCVQI